MPRKKQDETKAVEVSAALTETVPAEKRPRKPRTKKTASGKVDNISVGTDGEPIAFAKVEVEEKA